MIILKEPKEQMEESLPVLFNTSGIKLKIGCRESNLYPVQRNYMFYHLPFLRSYLDDLLKQVEPMDKEWKENIKDKWWMKPRPSILSEEYGLHDERLFDLRQRLLSFGGEAVCLPEEDMCIQKTLRYGQLWFGDQAQYIPMKKSQCHLNSLFLTEGDNPNLYMCTGYALSEDGMWREHSWVIDRENLDNKIIETTTRRVLYYGYVLNSYEREKFENILII